jgi:hypothetical protein
LQNQLGCRQVSGQPPARLTLDMLWLLLSAALTGALSVFVSIRLRRRHYQRIVELQRIGDGAAAKQLSQSDRSFILGYLLVALAVLQVVAYVVLMVALARPSTD